MYKAVREYDGLNITASGLGLVAARVRVGMCFCIVPISGDKLAVTINGQDGCVPINGEDCSGCKCWQMAMQKP